MAWHSVEKKAKPSLTSTLNGLGMAKLAELSKNRTLGPEAGAELSAVMRMVQAMESRGQWQSWGRTSGPPNPANQRRGRGRGSSEDPPSPWKSKPPPSGGAIGGSGPKPMRTCFLCGKDGHIAKDCRNRSPPQLSDWCTKLDFPSDKADKADDSPDKQQAPAWTCSRCKTEHTNHDKLSCRKCTLRREPPACTPPAQAETDGARDIPMAVHAPPVPSAAKLAEVLAILKANNVQDPETLLRIPCGPTPEDIPVDSTPSVSALERGQAINRIPDLNKRIQQQQENIAKYKKIIQQNQKELETSEAAVVALQADLDELIALAQHRDAHEDLCPAGEKDGKDLSPLLGNIRHVTQALADAALLDKEYSKYAETTASPLPAAAWIAQEMRKQLTQITDFCDAIGKEGGSYQLVKKRRTEGA